MSKICMIQNQVINKVINANSRAEFIKQLTEWVNEWPYDYHIALSVFGLISSMPCEFPDETAQGIDVFVGQ